MFILNDLNALAAVTEWVIEDGVARRETGRPEIRQETLVAQAWWQRGEKWF